MKNPKLLLTFFCFLFSFSVFAQSHPSSVLFHQLLRFKETKRILFVAAHPDDENTRLIAYLANAEHADVAYLSLTRGDGGQNLIGKELGIELGLIRTHELLRARETDGGRQLFTRALDFGFSKNPDETFRNWDREALLSDVVWIVRNYQPDIIINRFNTIPGTTHGHHTSSALLSIEAFSKAADPNAFPEQLKWVKPWQAQRVFWNAYNWGGQYEPEEGKIYHTFPVGEFNPLLGTTYSQIAADSRTMHKSQGFGATAQIGQARDFVELVKGSSFKDNPFEGISNKWLSLKNGQKLVTMIDEAVASFDFTQPVQNLPALLAIRKVLHEEKDEAYWLAEKKSKLDQLILDVLGIKAEFVVKKEIGFPGETINTEVVFNNPSSVELTLKSLKSPLLNQSISKVVKDNVPFTQAISLPIPQDYPISQPFWLENPIVNSLFGIEDIQKIGQPVNGPNVWVDVHFAIEGQEMKLQLPLEFKYNDQVDGEIKQPFTLVPEVNVALDKSNLFLVPGSKPTIQVEITFKNGINDGKVILEGLENNQYKLLKKELDEKRSRQLFHFELLDADAKQQEVTAVFLAENGQRFYQDTKRILYKHIPNLTYFTDASFSLVKKDLIMTPRRIGYINGAGDEVAEVIRGLGYEVSILDNGDIQKEKLKEFETVIVGIRAFNVNQALATNVDQLMDYVKEGGNLIVQYNTISPLLTRELGPYPFNITRSRVTVEGSPFKADFNHPILSFPNKVTEEDFEGWVQERGLYFTGNWDSQYSTPLAFQDPGEEFNEGSLLFTKYGEGTYTYSGISWFRQLPAGVPGAVKIFVNLIEQNGGK